MNQKDIPALKLDTPVILEMSHISKTFGAVTALVDVSIKLRQGEVLALVGDNGAGKSTLIKILSGFHHPDSGTIVYQGKEVHFGSPRDARARGIETVYQDLALINDLSIYHNMFIGREYHKRILGLKLLGQQENARFGSDLSQFAGDPNSQREQHSRPPVRRAAPVRRRCSFDLLVAYHLGSG